MIQDMLSVKLRRIRDEVIKMIPMMLDIAEVGESEEIFIFVM